MAYGTIVASVSEISIKTYRENAKAMLEASMSVYVSHLLAYRIQVEPLGSTLGKCIDGGEPLASRLWHPLRVPLFHEPLSVASLADDLERIWQDIQERHIGVNDNDFFGPQITNLFKLFTHAKLNRECVVTFLDRPGDRERASKVEIPLIKP